MGSGPAPVRAPGAPVREVAFDSTKRKRYKKMSKHRREKRRKQQRFLLRKLGKI